MFILWVLRFFCFRLYESPKFLMGRGRDAEAVAVLQKVAEYNGRKSTLTIEHLRSAELGVVRDELDTSAKAAAKRKLEKFDASHVKALFATRKMAWNTSLLIVLWGK